MDEKSLMVETVEDILPEQEEIQFEIRSPEISVNKFLLGGFLVGGVIFSIIAYFISSEIISVPELGTFTASEIFPSVLYGFGFGASTGIIVVVLYLLKKIKK